MTYAEIVRQQAQARRERTNADGGPGSGNFGHSGRPGVRGGSGQGIANQIKIGSGNAQAKMKSILGRAPEGTTVKVGSQLYRKFGGEWTTGRGIDIVNVKAESIAGAAMGQQVEFRTKEGRAIIKAKLVEQHGGLLRNPNCDLAKHIGEKNYDAMQSLVKGCGSEDAKTLWAHYEGKIRVKETSGNGFYSPLDNSIHINVSRATTDITGKPPHETTFHESGHYMDNALAKAPYGFFSVEYKNGAFGDAIRKDVNDFISAKEAAMKKSYKERGKKLHKSDVYAEVSRELRKLTDVEGCDIQDIFQGATRSKVSTKWGHKKNYWSDKSNVPIEAFAEMYSSSIANPESHAKMREYLPTASEVYDNMLKEMAEKAKTRG